jgi:methylmalonyl-CoA/ethylmalonyl-CoA epimerase
MRLHHVGLAVASIEKAAEQYRQLFGIGLSGLVVEDVRQKVRVAFAEVAAGVFVEFVEAVGEDSPVASIVKRGGGLYHLCFVVGDIEAAIEQIRRSGGRVVSAPQPAAAFDGRRIAFVYSPDRSLIEFLEE